MSIATHLRHHAAALADIAGRERSARDYDSRSDDLADELNGVIMALHAEADAVEHLEAATLLPSALAGLSVVATDG
jgi:hypothetical protein